MSTSEKLAKLNLAESILDSVSATLNNERTVCQCCGMEKFTFWNERQMREQLNGAITRIGRVKERLLNHQAEQARREAGPV